MLLSIRSARINGRTFHSIPPTCYTLAKKGSPHRRIGLERTNPAFLRDQEDESSVLARPA
jgi:hypothetical protein